jgi:hypothetical protein
VTITKPSNDATFCAHSFVCRGRTGRLPAAALIKVRQRIVAEVNELDLHVRPLRSDREDPPGDLLSVAVGAGASEDDPDSEHLP